LTLSGSASVADYQTALRSVAFGSSSDDPTSLDSDTTRTVSFTADDGALQSTAGTRDVAVIGVNDAPVVTTSSGSAAYTEGGAAAVVDPGVAVADADNANLAGASVSIGSPVTDDALSADTSGTSISASYDAGTLTLSGADTVAHYQQVLRTVTFSSSSQ